MRSDALVETTLDVPIKIDFQFRIRDKKHAIMVFRIADDDSLLISLGRLLLLWTHQNRFESIVVVNLVDGSYDGPKGWNVESTLELLFKKQVTVLQETVDDSTLMAPEYAKILGQRIIERVSR